jgi:hypothetical protein
VDATWGIAMLVVGLIINIVAVIIVLRAPSGSCYSPPGCC